MAETIHLRPSSPPRSPTNHAMPFFNKMKRKRDAGDPVSPQDEAPPLKKRTETMSHVQIPAFETQRVTHASPMGQTDRRLPVASAEFARSANSSQQASETQRSDTLASSLPSRGTVHTMDTTEDFGGQDSSQPHSPMPSHHVAFIRQCIESQFSLEILLKHKELRLIDQELAKCQIAFEQLRRCHVIPYPATSSSLAGIQSVGNGSGAAYNNTAPEAPAWGITNGPYTQHYAWWLLQDPMFDGSACDMRMLVHTGQSVSERLTRGSKSEKSTVASKSRSSRGTNNTRLTALPDGYPVPKEEKGPCIVIRSSDGKKVKLVCRDCWRSDFSSAQGFINHCRIQHHKTFKSHDAAINECGEEVDGNGEGGSVEVSGPPPAPASSGLVHPLVRSAFSHSATVTPKISTPSAKKRKESSAPIALTPSLASAPASAVDGPGDLFTPQRAPLRNLDSSSASQQPLNPSLHTPHLSALLAKIGKGGDLADMVAEAKTKPEVDLDLLSDDEDEVGAEEAADQSQPMVKNHSTRGVIRESAPAQINTSSVRRHPLGTDGTNDNPKITEPYRHHPAYPSPFSMRPDDANSQADTSMLDVNTPLNLSPHTTDPHPAPSLVSDDGDFENMHSDSESPSDMGDERDPHHEPEVMDHDDIHMGEASGLNLGHTKHHHHHHGPPTEIVAVGRRSRPSTATDTFEHGGEHDEQQRHVSVVNPSRGPRRGSKAKDEQ